MSARYIVASAKDWHFPRFQSLTEGRQDTWIYVRSPEELKAALSDSPPIYVFFLHWNWIVPEDIFSRHECVCFHMTDVPYGRGGSPLQNLISLGHTDTVVTALRMVKEVDAGPVYAKRSLSLEGRAEEIYLRAGEICWDMILWMIRARPVPVSQIGQPTHFVRRKPEQSLMPMGKSLKAIYDHIRMLDAPGYPLSFIRHGQFLFEFSQAEMDGDVVKASVVIRQIDKEKLP